MARMSMVETIMRRDGITRDEARFLVKETMDMMADCNYDPDECEEIMMDMLGLEMDYLI